MKSATIWTLPESGLLLRRESRAFQSNNSSRFCMALTDIGRRSAFSKRPWTMHSLSVDSTTSKRWTLSNRKCFAYLLEVYSRKGSKRSMTARLFPKDEFHPFEVAQLANLCCETAEEAKILIPRWVPSF